MRCLPLALLLATLLPAAAQAQQPSQAEMRQMMEAMQGMQACMAGVDPASLQRLRQQAEQAEAEMRRLCRAGQPQAAQARALELGRQMGEDPVLKTMQTCLARLPKLPMGQPASPLGQLSLDDEPIESGQRSVCERLR